MNDNAQARSPSDADLHRPAFVPPTVWPAFFEAKRVTGEEPVALGPRAHTLGVMMGLSAESIFRACRAGRVRSVQAGRVVRVPWAEVARLLEEGL